MESLDFYITVRSPFSYLAAPRVAELAERFDLTVRLRPVYPLAQRDPTFFARSNPNLMTYNLRDAERSAEMLGMPYRWPDPDPVVQDLETLEIAEEQPYVRRLSHLALVAEEAGKGLAFYRALSILIFDPAGGWDQGERVAGAALKAGLDWSVLEKRLADEAEALEAALADNARAMERAGHWGTPLLVYRGEPFFGQDRIDVCAWRIAQSRASD